MSENTQTHAPSVEIQKRNKKVPPAVPPKPKPVSPKQVLSSGPTPDSTNSGTANIISPTPASAADGNINNDVKVISLQY